MIKALIVDDEAAARSSLEAMLKRYAPEIDSLEMAGSASDAFFMIKDFKPDLVFLDIQMPFLNGLDLLSKIDVINFDIVFTTAYNQYAIQAIRFSALDYLLKPIDVNDLKNAVQRCLQRRETILQTNQQYKNLVQNLAVTRNEEFKLAVNGTQGVHFFQINEIIRMEGDRNYSNFYLTDKRKLISSKNLKEYEEILTGKGFIRCHKSHLVNKLFIESFISETVLLLKDDSKIEVSRRRLPEVKSSLNIS